MMHIHWRSYCDDTTDIVTVWLLTVEKEPWQCLFYSCSRLKLRCPADITVQSQLGKSEQLFSLYLFTVRNIWNNAGLSYYREFLFLNMYLKAWMNSQLSKRNFNLPIMWHILVSKPFVTVNLMTVLSPGQRCPEKLQISLWGFWITLCFFQTTLMTSIFPSKYSFQSQFSLHLCLTPMWNLWAITIKFSYKASQQRKLLYWRWQHESAGWGRKEGWREGWMAAEEVYSCLQARPYLSRRLLWWWPSCHHTAHTKQLHVSFSWAALFVISSCLSTLHSVSLCVSVVLHYVIRCLLAIHPKSDGATKTLMKWL